MVELIKRRARKPLVEDGNAWTGTNIKWTTSSRAGFVEAGDDSYRYTLTMVGKEADDRAEYIASLTESEMLTVALSWLDTFKTKRLREEEKARGRKP